MHGKPWGSTHQGAVVKQQLGTPRTDKERGSTNLPGCTETFEAKRHKFHLINTKTFFFGHLFIGSDSEMSRSETDIRLIVPKGGYEDNILITGFHGIGMTGYIAINHLLNALEAERIGYIQTRSLPPFVSVQGKQLLTPFEVYKWDRFVFIRSEFPPHRSEENMFSRKIAEWAVEKQFREAMLVGGLDRRFRSSPEYLRMVPTKTYLDRNQVIKDLLLEEGLYVTGPLAIMLTAFEVCNFPAVAILPYASRDIPDPRAAAVAINRISEIYQLEIDVSDLVQDAEKIERELEERRMRTGQSYDGMYV